MRDRHAATIDALLPDLDAAATRAVLKPIVDRDAVLVSDGRAASRQFANANGLLHIAVIASAGEHTGAAITSRTPTFHARQYRRGV